MVSLLFVGEKVKKYRFSVLTMYSRPRGRSRLGCTWDTTAGKWVPCANAPTQTPIAKKTTRTFRVVVAPPPSYTSRQTLPTSTYNTTVCQTTKSLEEEYARNEQRFYEESRRIEQEVHEKEEAELAAEKEAKDKRQQEAKTDAKRRVFMYPYDTAKNVYDYHNRSSDKRVYTYWMDSNLDIYEYPANPYNKPVKPKIEPKRSFVWKSRMRTCKVTHDDDPHTLDPGEWEYRDMMCWYKSYM